MPYRVPSQLEIQSMPTRNARTEAISVKENTILLVFFFVFSVVITVA